MKDLEHQRLHYQPKTPRCFENFNCLSPAPFGTFKTDDAIAPFFEKLLDNEFLEFRQSSENLSNPLCLGVVFSGGPAPGGHNVVAGVYDALQKINPLSRLIGFVGGPSGIINNNWLLLDAKKINSVRNLGGFDLLGSGRTKIETEEQLLKCKEACESSHLDGLIIIGGDDSNTNAAFLANYFLKSSCKTTVVGVPKTIDGDLTNQWVETSFGFDSASKTYSEFIGNVMTDAKSQGKYTFFVKVMGRTASHLVLECAMQTNPNLALISEEIESKKTTLKEIVNEIADLVADRAKIGKNYGVILIPEGFIEFIPEFKKMMKEFGGEKDPMRLSQESFNFFQTLPIALQTQFFLNADPHGNMQVSKMETERLLMTLVEKELKNRSDFLGDFNPQPLFLGYEGRSCFPSNFDCNYCYSLGMTAALLCSYKKTGTMAVIRNLGKSHEEWIPEGIPLLAMIHLAFKKGEKKPVIHQNLVDLSGLLFQEYDSKREHNRLVDNYINPGPIQFFGPVSITDRITDTLKFSTYKESLL